MWIFGLLSSSLFLFPLCGNNNKDEANSSKTLNDKNHQASSQKLRQQTPEEGRTTYRPKRRGNNNKDEDNSPKTLNDKNHQASSQKFRQLNTCGFTFTLNIFKPSIPSNDFFPKVVLYTLHNGLALLYKYMSTRTSEGSAPISVTQSRVIPFA